MIPTIDLLPSPAPSTDDPDDFDERGDALLGALPPFVVQQNATIAAMNETSADIDDIAASAGEAVATANVAAAAALDQSKQSGPSSSSNSLTTGSKTFRLTKDDGTALSAGDKVFGVDDAVVAIRKSAPNQKMFFKVATWDGVDDLTGTVLSTDDIVGSGGPYTDWFVILAIYAQFGASTAEIRQGTSFNVATTPGGEFGALAEVTLTDASVVAVDMSAFINGVLTFTSAVGDTRVLGNPTNPKVGQEGCIRLIQDATGGRSFSVGSNWKRVGGVPIPTPTANATDVLVYKVITPTLILYDLRRNPT